MKRLPSLPIRLVLPRTEDIIAAALPQNEGATLVTGDPELKAMSDSVMVEWIDPAAH